MIRSYRKILRDRRLKGDDKYKKQTKVYDNSIVPDDLNKEYVRIDNSMVDIVKNLNDIESVRSVSSCSGVFEEHYDVEIVRMLLPYAELLGSIDLTVENIDMPVLGIEPVYHNKTEQGYDVSREFYELKKEVGGSTYDVENQKDFSWEVSVSPTNVDKNRIELVYAFRPTSTTFAQSLKMSESYEDMDENIRSSISNLEEFLIERLG